MLPGGVLPLRPERTVSEPCVELGWPGLEPKKPCLDVFIFDSSGSVTAPLGNDPVGNRFAEAKAAIRLVAQWSFTDRSKVAILHFDHPRGASGVVSLNDRHLTSKLGPVLGNPGGAGTSDVLPAVMELERLAAVYPDHDVRATIFSDFELTDPHPEEIFTRLGSFPGRIHAVVLGGHVPPDLFQDTITVTMLTPADAPGTFAAALLRSMTATRRGARYSVLHTPRAGKRVLS
ncbi:MAG: hypothetical protein ABS61_05550 [Microbacterium sp. SCN 70-18]|nr:MAG: hypothetical protein ABS61_05550 [Microbacterium sp. SCN 70-18]